MKKVVILGSTGSIGTQGLQVIEASSEQFEVLALTAYSNTEAILFQTSKTRPKYIGIADETKAKDMKDRLPPGTELMAGAGINEALATLPEADIILHGISGIAGLAPLLAALRAGKTVALANKESIVCGNALVKVALQEYGGKIIPVDSEHSAIFQCMQNGERSEAETLHLTASGGPFWQMAPEELQHVTIEQALNHPIWRMGNKISIDSATLMNKGLEVIEASYLFDIPYEHITVLIHPQSIVHSMVEYKDGAVIAQLSVPDMRLAIQYALNYPNRMERQIDRLSLSEIGKLTFFPADDRPAIRLAKEALSGGDALALAYCAANDAAVELFLGRETNFTGIIDAVEYAMGKIENRHISSLQDVMYMVEKVQKLVKAYCTFHQERKPRIYASSSQHALNYRIAGAVKHTGDDT